MCLNVMIKTEATFTYEPFVILSPQKGSWMQMCILRQIWSKTVASLTQETAFSLKEETSGNFSLQQRKLSSKIWLVQKSVDKSGLKL